MEKLFDKLLLFLGSLLFPFAAALGWTEITALLLAVAATALHDYLTPPVRLLPTAAFCLSVFFLPAALPFLSVAVYDSFSETRKPLRFLWVLPLLFRLPGLSFQALCYLLVFVSAAWLLCRRRVMLEHLEQAARETQDLTKEASLHLEQKNRDLMEKQDYEVRLAMLNERNRIAREIHDNVGHMLTRSILQAGALEVVAKGNELGPGITELKGTLDSAMDAVRSSVHDLHDESVELRMQLLAVVEAFTFCPVKFQYDTGELPKAVKYCMIAVVREALSNVAKHSDATEVTLSVIEHPALCQLVIRDNGTLHPKEDENGIGLKNMADRVEALHGTFRVTTEKGFQIFISIPKEQKEARE